MSQATNQSLALISLVAGTMSEMLKRKLVSRVDMRKRVQKIMIQAEDVINKWPETGDGQHNTRMIIQWLHEWDQKYFDHSTRHKESAVQLAAMCDVMLCDLLDLVRDPRKVRLLTELHSEIKEVHEWLDQDYRNFPAMERAAFNVENLYSVMGV